MAVGTQCIDRPLHRSLHHASACCKPGRPVGTGGNLCIADALWQMQDNTRDKTDSVNSSSAQHVLLLAKPCIVLLPESTHRRSIPCVPDVADGLNDLQQDNNAGSNTETTQQQPQQGQTPRTNNPRAYFSKHCTAMHLNSHDTTWLYAIRSGSEWRLIGCFRTPTAAYKPPVRHRPGTRLVSNQHLTRKPGP